MVISWKQQVCAELQGTSTFPKPIVTVRIIIATTAALALVESLLYIYHGHQIRNHTLYPIR
jgi:hypothetical protein